MSHSRFILYVFDVQLKKIALISAHSLSQIQKRLLAADPEDLSLLTDLGILYELAEHSELSKPIFEKVIVGVIDNPLTPYLVNLHSIIALLVCMCMMANLFVVNVLRSLRPTLPTHWLPCIWAS